MLPVMVLPADCGCLFETTFAFDTVADNGSIPSVGIHLENVAVSVTFSMYQTFRVASHLAPNRFASSFSAKGTRKFVLISSSCGSVFAHEQN